ncbi:MAG: phytanoyl-CoA dioxygenase family protein [Bacteroidota bacterium]
MKAMFIKTLKRFLYKWIELPFKQLLVIQKPSLTPIQSKILCMLNEQGIAVTTFDELFGTNALSAVEEEYARFYQNKTIQQIKVDSSNGTAENNPNYKNYNIRASSISPVQSYQSILLRKGLNTQLGNIAFAYFKEHALLRYADYWLSIPVPVTERNYSQNWHRDPEDQRILKVFVYLNDVTHNNGAFEYIKGSHLNGPYNSVFPYDEKHPNNYPDEHELRKQISPDAFTVNEGKKGTVIICDTHGFHRGGYCKTGDRWLMTYMYNRASLIMSNQFKVDFRSKLTGTQKRFYATFG